MASLILKEERNISRGGNSPVLYLPRKYFAPGEKVNFRLLIDHGNVQVVLTKSLYNFTCDSIKESVGKKFNVEYDKTIAGVHVFNAIRGDLSLNYTQSTHDLEPAYVTVSRRFNKIESKKDYARLLKSIEELKSRNFDAYLEPEGDLDSLSVYKEPERYGLKDESDAVEVLRKTGKRLDFSIVVRFNNRKNNMDEINLALKELQLKA